MKLYNITINNLRRRKAKMAFVAIGMIIGIATIVSLHTITSAMKTEIADKFDQIGANMTVVPLSDSLSMSYEGVSTSDVGGKPNLMTMSDVEKIRTIHNKENIAIVAPKFLDTVQVESKDMLVMGIQFANELRMKKWWDIQGSKPENSSEIIMGSRVAQDIGKTLGDDIDIKGHKYRVAGILKEMGNQEDSVIFVDLEELQVLTGKTDAVSYIEVAALCSTCPIEDITAQISDKLPDTKVSAIKEVVQARKDFVDRFAQLGIAVSAIVLVIGSLVVFITMMSSVNDRTREIGIFRAIGFRKSHIMGIIFMEAGIVSILGGLAGYILGMVTARFLSPLIAQMEVSITWNLQLGFVAIGVALFIGLGASLFPAIKASGQDPVEALRFI